MGVMRATSVASESVLSLGSGTGPIISSTFRELSSAKNSWHEVGGPATVSSANANGNCVVGCALLTESSITCWLGRRGTLCTSLAASCLMISCSTHSLFFKPGSHSQSRVQHVPRNPALLQPNCITKHRYVLSVWCDFISDIIRLSGLVFVS